ncbi:unnamed protein product [Ilex paraguariensis]|uniref:Uncharacterized protein n=1 Tax=Ilex paraguariensis TaxID=185542 RepID=A0ABC8SNV8_9AQUA
MHLVEAVNIDRSRWISLIVNRLVVDFLGLVRWSLVAGAVADRRLQSKTPCLPPWLLDCWSLVMVVVPSATVIY